MTFYKNHAARDRHPLYFSYLMLTGALIIAPITSTRAEAVIPFVHPGLLHTQKDFERMHTKVTQGAQPYRDGWQRLLENKHASLGWHANPQAVIYRGEDGIHTENYGTLFKDAAAAYALALRWKISGDDAYARKAIGILNAWTTTLTAIRGGSDRYLASGLYGYQFANAAEILRSSVLWKPTDFHDFQTMMLSVFYPMNKDFLDHHNGAKIDHYWANWDLANMDAMLAIGVLTDRRDIYNEAMTYFKHGQGNGSVEHLVWKLYGSSLGQVQESGRDQAHSLLDIALLGAEYVAKYNLMHDVPYTPYTNSDVTQPVISDKSRGQMRPLWALFYNHYVVLKWITSPYVEAFAKKPVPRTVEEIMGLTAEVSTSSDIPLNKVGDSTFHDPFLD